MELTHTLHAISLDGALRIAQATLAKGRQAGMLPLAVAVLDPRGTVKAFLAEEGTSLYRFDIARGKALGGLGMGFGGQELEKRYGHVPGFIQAVQGLSDGNLVPVRGGVLIRNAQGQLLGAVGVSGETSAHDEIAAVAGIESVGLAPDCGGPKP